MVAVPLRSQAAVETVPQRIFLRPVQNRLLFTGSYVNRTCRDGIWLPAIKLAFERVMQRICTARDVLCGARCVVTISVSDLLRSGFDYRSPGSSC
jgi:hypothetical protein